MPIIDYLAKGMMHTLSKDDFRRIMNDTLDHMLRVMSRRERKEFIDDMVTNAVSKMLTGLSNEEKADLLRGMLPRVLEQFPSLGEELSQKHAARADIQVAEDAMGPHEPPLSENLREPIWPTAGE